MEGIHVAEGKDCDRADCYELFNVTLRNSLSRVLPNKLTVPQLVTFPVFYGTRRFITVFTTAHHLFLSSTRLFQSAPSNPITLISIVILSSHLHLGLPIGLFPSRFPLYTCLLPPPPSRHMPHLCHPWFDHPSRIWNSVCSMQFCPYSCFTFFFSNQYCA